jgi:tetratricopeptide (TPR) repeat protein
MELARPMGDYILCIDADEWLECEDGFALPELKADAYEIPVRMRGIEFARPMLLRSALEGKWVGTRHPHLEAKGAGVIAGLRGMVNMAPPRQGASWSDPDKYKKHAAELRGQVEASRRQWYYLAQSYRDAGDLDKAAWAYDVRAELHGWPEEVWSALYERAKCLEALGRSVAEVTAAYHRACIVRPQRAEAWHRLAEYLRKADVPASAEPFAREAARLPRPPDRLFVEYEVYEWRALDGLSVCLSKLGRNAEAKRYAAEALLKAPESQRSRIKANIAHMEKAS